MAANAAPTPDASTIRQIKRRAARNFAIVENVDVGGERDIYFQQSLDWSDAALFGGTQIILETKKEGPLSNASACASLVPRDVCNDNVSAVVS